MKTDVCRKAIQLHTDSSLNFGSNHGTQHMESVIRDVVKREEDFSTDDVDKVAEARRIKQVGT